MSAKSIPPSFREAILQAFRKIGGVKHMAQWAEDNPTDFYRLAGRLLAMEKSPDPPPVIPAGKFSVSTQLVMFNDGTPQA